MILTWSDAQELVKSELKKNISISESRKHHFYSKNLLTFNNSMKSFDILITAAWTLTTLDYINSVNNFSKTKYILNRCRSNLIELLRVEKKIIGSQFKKESLCLLSKIYALRGEKFRSEWYNARVGNINNSDFEYKINEPASYNYSKVMELFIMKSEPYLAWQHLILKENKLNNELKCDYIGEYFIFSFLAPQGEFTQILRKKIMKDPNEILYCFFSMLAQGEKSWTKELRLVKLIKENKSEYSSILRSFIKLVQIIDDSKVKTEQLLFDLEDLYAQVPHLPPILQVLVLSIILKILEQRNQKSLIPLLKKRFSLVNLQLSNGNSTDVFKLFKSKPNKENLLLSQDSNVLHTIPYTFNSRFKSGFSLTYEISKVMGPKRLSYFLTGKRYKIHLKKSERKEILDLISNKMSELKGPLMKMGQTLSYTQTSLPKDIAKAFSKLPDQSQPLDFLLIMRQIQDFGCPSFLNQIEYIDSSPIGIGSIGQVHKGKLKTGEEIAVKVKYPNAEKIIESDFQIIKLCSRIFKLINPKFPLDSFIYQLEKSILLECNYLQEAFAMERFYHRFKNDPHIVIPKVFKNLSSSNILVSSYESGMKLNEVVSLSSRQRELWGQSIVKFVVSSCRDGDFNTDPHPGNFLFRDNQVVCLDFGSTSIWKPQTLQAWNLLILASVEKNKKYLLQAFDVLNSHNKYSDEVIDQFFQALTLEGAEEFWTRNGFQKVSPENLSRQLNKIIKLQSYFKMPSEIIFGMRVYFGHLSLISLLGSEYNWNQFVKDIMEPWKNTLYQEDALREKIYSKT